MSRTAFLLAVFLISALPVPVKAGESIRSIMASEKQAPASPATEYSHRLTIRTLEGDDHIFHVELAVRPEDQVRGLMYRTELPQDAGMLFIFPESQNRYFWMKNTFIPLDLVFIEADGTIHHIHENAVPHDLTQISSHGPVSAVLEISGGEAARLGIKSGDKITGSKFFK